MNGQITEFIRHHYRHFNAAALIDAAEGYKKHLDGGGKMMITLAGAMSTAELGLSLAEMIRQDKVQIISCTGANLEEDLFNLVAHDFYERVPNYRDLTPEDEQDLLNRHMNRVTDTCIPEHEAMRKIEKKMLALWEKAQKATRPPQKALVASTATPRRRRGTIANHSAHPTASASRAPIVCTTVEPAKSRKTAPFVNALRVSGVMLPSQPPGPQTQWPKIG